MNSRDSWIDQDSLHGLARDLSGLSGPPRPGEKEAPPPPAAGARLPVTRLKPEDFRLPEHFLPAPFPPEDGAERAKAREVLQSIRAKAESTGLVSKTPHPPLPEAVPAEDKSPPSSGVPGSSPAAAAPDASPAKGGVPPAGPSGDGGTFTVAPPAAPVLPPGKSVPLPRLVTPFEPPLGPLATRFRALGDWIRRQVGAVETFILDPKGQPVCDRRPAPALTAAAVILAEAAHQALQDLPAGESGAVTLDLRGERKFCVVPAETAEGRYCLCLTLAEALPNRAAERLRRALQRAVEPAE